LALQSPISADLAGQEVFVLERNSSVGQETSSRSSEVIHAMIKADVVLGEVSGEIVATHLTLKTASSVAANIFHKHLSLEEGVSSKEIETSRKAAAACVIGLLRVPSAYSCSRSSVRSLPSRVCWPRIGPYARGSPMSDCFFSRGRIVN
jgi:hypothetical protein